MTSNDIHDRAVENMVNSPQQTVKTWFYNGAWHTQQDYENYIHSKEMSLVRLADASERMVIAFEKMAEAAERIANAFDAYNFKMSIPTPPKKPSKKE